MRLLRGRSIKSHLILMRVMRRLYPNLGVTRQDWGWNPRSSSLNQRDLLRRRNNLRSLLARRKTTPSSVRLLSSLLSLGWRDASTAIKSSQTRAWVGICQEPILVRASTTKRRRRPDRRESMTDSYSERLKEGTETNRMIRAFRLLPWTEQCSRRSESEWETNGLLRRP